VPGGFPDRPGDINERRPFPKLDDELGRYLATPLWQAAYQNKIEDAQLLLDLGADIESRDTKSGMTPLQILVHGFRYQPQRAEPLIELLLARGANPNALAWDGSRLLDCETTCRVETLF